MSQPGVQGMTGEAPGRLDFLGGVADYSGSLVLEKPIRARTRVTIRQSPGGRLEFASEGLDTDVAVEKKTVDACIQATDTAAIRSILDAASVPAWVRYLLGCYLVLIRAHRLSATDGLRFEVCSTVPRSMGVSSSAALEVATLRALRAFLHVEFSDLELAHLAQQAENEIVGAPCGLMDQLAVSCGHRDRILPILCRPDKLRTPLPVPADIAIVGWPSGVQHAVSGNPYLRARTATFAGFAQFQQALGRRFECPAAIPLEVFQAHVDRLPESIAGAELLQQDLQLADSLSRVYPDEDYNLRSALAFPIEENARAERAESIVRNADADLSEDALTELGQLLFEAHAGYTSIGLGHPKTDAMVDAVRGLRAQGLFGARVSGGGSGGTVVVLLRRESLPVLRRLVGELTPTAQLIE